MNAPACLVVNLALMERVHGFLKKHLGEKPEE